MTIERCEGSDVCCEYFTVWGMRPGVRLDGPQS